MKRIFLFVLIFTYILIYGQISYNQLGGALENAMYNKTLVYGDYLFAYGKMRLEIYDLSANPISPQLINTIEYSRNDVSLKYIVLDERLYVLRDECRLMEVYDISDPTNLEMVFTKTFSRYSYVGVTDNYIIDLLPSGENSFSISSRSTGEYIGSYTDEYIPFHTGLLNGNLLYLEHNLFWYCYEDEVYYTRILNVEEYNNIYEVANRPFEDLKYNNYYRNQYITKDDSLYAIVPNYDTFYIYNLSNDGTSCVSSFSCSTGDVAYEATLTDSILIYHLQNSCSINYYNLSDLENPIVRRRDFFFDNMTYLPRAYQNFKIAAYQNYAYISFAFEGIWVFDISDLDAIRKVNKIIPNDWTDFRFLKQDNLCFLRSLIPADSSYTDYPNSYPVIDISDIDNPELLELPGVATSRGNINVLGSSLVSSKNNISDIYEFDSSGPLPEYRFSIDGWMFYYNLIDSTGYFIDNYNTLAKYSLVGGQKTLLYSIFLEDNELRVYDYCYINDDLVLLGGHSFDSLHIIKDNGFSFTACSSLGDYNSYYYIDYYTMMDENTVIVCYTYQNNIKLVKYDITDANNPVEIASGNYYYNEMTPIVNDISSKNGFIAVCALELPVKMFNTDLEYIGNITEKPYSTCKFHEDSYFLAKSYYEFAIYEYEVNSITNEIKVTQKKSVPQISNYPNPFNPSTRIDLDVGKDYNVADVNIYNAKGQLIKSYGKIALRDGKANIVWDGKNDAGDSASSGVYFYQVVAGGEAMGTKKMIMLK